jgi:hypothetical protein
MTFVESTFILMMIMHVDGLVRKVNYQSPNGYMAREEWIFINEVTIMDDIAQK